MSKRKPSRTFPKKLKRRTFIEPWSFREGRPSTSGRSPISKRTFETSANMSINNRTEHHKEKQKDAIAAARSFLQRVLGVAQVSAAEVRGEVEAIYGPLTDDTWYRWCRKVDAAADALLGPGMLSTVTRHLLRCNALSLSGNKAGSAKKQIRMDALAYLAVNMSEVSVDEWLASFAHIPDKMSATEIEERIRSQKIRQYSPRHLRRNGIRRRKPVYYKPEIVQILKRFDCA